LTSDFRGPTALDHYRSRLRMLRHHDVAASLRCGGETVLMSRPWIIRVCISPVQIYCSTEFSCPRMYLYTLPQSPAAHQMSSSTLRHNVHREQPYTSPISPALRQPPNTRGVTILGTALHGGACYESKCARGPESRPRAVTSARSVGRWLPRVGRCGSGMQHKIGEHTAPAVKGGVSVSPPSPPSSEDVRGPHCWQQLKAGLITAA